MKRMIAVLVALMLCAAMVVPAAASTFTPSVTYKPGPSLVPVPGVMDDAGNPAWGTFVDEEGFLQYLFDQCLIITSIAEAKTSTMIPDTSREMLLWVYEQLTSGAMKLPYEKFGLDASKMVIRDLFDATFLCGSEIYTFDHPQYLAPKGIMIELTFDLGVAADETVYTMTYKENQWNPIVKTVNNGDGTVTCTFERLCPVVFCVELSEEGGNQGGSEGGNQGGNQGGSEGGNQGGNQGGSEGGNQGGNQGGTGEKPGVTGDVSMTLWIVTASISLMALVALVVVYRNKYSKNA